MRLDSGSRFGGIIKVARVVRIKVVQVVQIVRAIKVIRFIRVHLAREPLVAPLRDRTPLQGATRIALPGCSGSSKRCSDSHSQHWRLLLTTARCMKDVRGWS